jgi:hypothetical protein
MTGRYRVVHVSCILHGDCADDEVVEFGALQMLVLGGKSVVAGGAGSGEH